MRTRFRPKLSQKAIYDMIAEIIFTYLTVE